MIDLIKRINMLIKEEDNDGNNKKISLDFIKKQKEQVRTQLKREKDPQKRAILQGKLAKMSEHEAIIKKKSTKE
ncbi:MAG: hypothetical protein WC346_16885 [Methanogenium sp.]|jgi:hypothetical protein